MRKVIFSLIGIVMLVVGLSACDDGSKSGQDTEDATGQSNYNHLVKQEPAHSMNYSYTRQTINFFTDTWGKPGKNAYVYLLNNAGKVISYGVFDGPPVSMCVSIRPTYKFVDPKGDGEYTLYQVPAPSADGAYYSGGECNTFYGKDASTGAYVQYTAGQGINPVLRDQPWSPETVQGATNLATGKVKQ